MRRLRLLYLLIFALSAGTTAAQDVHYTLHDYAPLWLNPAQTGAYSGSLRVGGIFRGQWDGLTSINSPTAFADAPIIKGFRKYDWIGAGASLVTDNAGQFDLKSTFFGISGAYHLALDSKRRNVFTLGVQYGSTSYSFEVDGPVVQEETIGEELGGQGNTMGEQFPTSSQGNAGGQSGNSGSESYSDVNAGVMFRTVLDPKKNNTLEFGVALLHLNSPERRSLIQRNTNTMNPDSTNTPTPGGNNSEDVRKRRPTLHANANANLEMSDNWRLQPTLFYQSSAGTSSLSIQAWGQRDIKKDLGLRVGLGYRTGDAVKALAGLEFGQLRAALSYDFIRLAGDNVSTVNQSAFEITANYIFNIYKKPEVTPTMLCPRI